MKLAQCETDARAIGAERSVRGIRAFGAIKGDKEIRKALLNSPSWQNACDHVRRTCQAESVFFVTESLQRSLYRRLTRGWAYVCGS